MHLIKEVPWIIQVMRVCQQMGVKEIPWQKVFAALYVQLCGGN